MLHRHERRCRCRRRRRPRTTFVGVGELLTLLMPIFSSSGSASAFCHPRTISNFSSPSLNIHLAINRRDLRRGQSGAVVPMASNYFHRLLNENKIQQPLKSTVDDNNNEETDNLNEDGIIFYDDFSGMPIGQQDAVVVGIGQEQLQPQQVKEGVVDVNPIQLPDFDNDDNDGENTSKNIQIKGLSKVIKDSQKKYVDLTGSTEREFSLGRDVILSNYAGSLGFDQVTDWQYYTVDVEEDDGGYYSKRKEGEEPRRTPVSPRPMDPSQPSRTRSSSGSVVRIFRGELVGGSSSLGSKLRSRGLDMRVLIKEYSGEEGLKLANAEKQGLGRLQSSWLRSYYLSKNDAGKVKELEDGEWIERARRRYVDGITNTSTNKDDENLITMIELLSSQKAPFTSLLGELNLNDFYDDDDFASTANLRNEWYKSLGVQPPRVDSVWLIFDYHGLSTASTYAVPAVIQRSKLPPRRGIFGFGVVEAPPLPSFTDRARYMVRGVLLGMLSAVAAAHKAGVVHRSIGRNSFLLSSIGQDKREATSPYAVTTSRLRVILSDWGFSATVDDAAREKELGVRSRMFGIPAMVGGGIDDDRLQAVAKEFAKAEDLHALGFV